MECAGFDPHLGQAAPGRVAVDAEAPQRRVGIGRQVLHPLPGVQQDEAVADPGGMVVVPGGGGVGVCPIGDHPGQAAEEGEVAIFEAPPDAVARHWELAQQDGDGAAAEVHGNRQGLHPAVLIGQIDAAVDADTGPQRKRAEWPLRRGDHPAEEVVGMHGLAGDGTAVCGDDEVGSAPAGAVLRPALLVVADSGGG